MKCNQICKWNSNAGCVKPYGVPCILENVSPTDKKATNADRIRDMSDEELAWELMLWRCEAVARHHGISSEYPDTQKTILDWLQNPAEEDER